MRQDDEVVGKRAQLELVQVYLSHMQLPVQLRRQIESFFHARLRDSSSTQIDIYDLLPAALQIEVSTVTNRAMVGELALLRGCSETFVDRLSSLLRERTVEPETSLFNAGDVCKEVRHLPPAAECLFAARTDCHRQLLFTIGAGAAPPLPATDLPQLFILDSGAVETFDDDAPGGADESAAQTNVYEPVRQATLLSAPTTGLIDCTTP
jgi:hypothetical protein